MNKNILFLGFLLLFFEAVAQSIYEQLPAIGEIEVTLHPGSSVTTTSNQVVSFGMPFPRNTVNDISQILVTDLQGNEIASDIKELTRWHSLSDDPDTDGVRAALLQFNFTFNDLNPQPIKVIYGQNRTLELNDQGDPTQNWVIVQDTGDEYPDDINDSNYVELKEPSVYVTLPSEWMSKCVIRTKFIPSNQVTSKYEWYDEALLNFGRTAINDVAGTVEEQHKINILEPAPWLFDRAGCFWNIYMKTGELKWLKASHKASQFYASHLNAEGWFDLKGWDDLKYSFSGSMLIDLMLTGDISLRDKIEDVAELAERKNFLLEDGFSFWTERHFTYWLLGALSAFEATGEEKYKIQTNERAAHAFFRARNPINGYLPEGGILHPMGPHEGANTPDPGNDDVKGYYQPIISPWLSALMAEAIWRYYLHSEDEEALQFLVGLGENVARHCIYEVTDVHPGINGNIQPYYLVSGQTEDRYLRNQIYWKPWDDNDHAQDVMVLLARSRWAQKKLGLNPEEMNGRINDLLVTSKYTLEKWTRTEPTRPRYRLTPPRKFNWWFGTTSDYEWLMTNEPEDILAIDEFDETNKKLFSILPNPAFDKVSIKGIGTNTLDSGKITLYDINGRNLKSMEVEHINDSSVHIESISPGVYFLKISSGAVKEIIRVIKK